jgi:hypothetical protein
MGWLLLYQASVGTLGEPTGKFQPVISILGTLEVTGGPYLPSFGKCGVVDLVLAFVLVTALEPAPHLRRYLCGKVGRLAYTNTGFAPAVPIGFAMALFQPAEQLVSRGFSR